MTGRILVVDDEPNMAELLEEDLRRRGYDVDAFTKPEEALAALRERDYDTLLTDLRMPRMTGLELCRKAGELKPDVPVVLMTAFGSMESAVEALRAGADDFITKPVELDLLALTLQRSIDRARMRERVKTLESALDDSAVFGELIGESDPMKRLFEQLRRVAPSDASVLITGESGVGKEMVARAIHENSRRRSGPFIAVNCAAIPETLMESELFGHAKGAFTDARADRAGLFREAEGGTLFLDEIGEMPVALQAKLLRSLESGLVRPVGGSKEVPFDVRLVSATNRELEQAIVDQTFREDLYFRINVIQLEVPPLRRRGADVLVLARHFLKTFAARTDRPVRRLSESAAAKLLAYDWPGNVRELRNVIERAVVLTQFDSIAIEDLPDKVQKFQPDRLAVPGATNEDELVPLDQIERRYIEHVLERTGGNRTLAAKILGLDRKTLYRKLKTYGMEEEKTPAP